ncbi:MAG: protein kinase [Anaerolineales bacterium]|nr:protein kinase [Anaerolineales bacterium]MCB8983639.1 protein kinase [Ardenticatenaceae bacterium]
MAFHSIQTQINARYIIQEKLGEGAMGVVYRATDRITGDTIALKRVTINSSQLDFASRAAQGNSGNVRLALAQEFRTLSSLRHPHIISVLDYGFDADRQPYFTMDLLEEGQTLLAAGGNQPVEAQVTLLIQVLQALSYLHRRGILHRDLKPANVLVNEQGQVKVLDFGLSTAVEHAKGTSGTLTYMAPEVIQGQSVSQASDLYSVGMMAYELFTGRYPFNLRSPSRLIAHIVALQPDVSPIDNPKLAAVVARLLAKDPAARHQDANAVIRDLSAAIQHAPPQESSAIRDSFLQAAQFVGRDTELAQLTGALQATMQGSGSAWLIGGESGVGKSRLLDELRTQALVAGAIVLRGQAVEGGGLPYQLWRDAAQLLALQTPLSDLEAGVLKPLVPNIALLLGREVLDAPELTGKSGEQRLTFTLIDLLKRQNRPLVLLLEDLQWATESLGPLQQIVLLRDQMPHLLLIATYRDDERPGLPDELAGAQVLKLARLTQKAVAALARSMLGNVGQRQDVVELLHHETEGNVFFMVETVRALAEEAGTLSAIGVEALPATVFAGGVQRLVVRRLSRVPAVYRALLERVAVAGRAIDSAVLAHLGGAAEAAAFLQAGAEAAVLEVADGAWRFAHDKLREGLLRSIPDEDKQQQHRAVAEAIEAVYPDDAAYYDVLMDHWRVAGDVARELHYLLPVVEDMVNRRAQYGRADELITRGQALLPPDDARNAALLNNRSYGHWMRGEFDIAQPVAEAARVHAEKLALSKELQDALSHLGVIANARSDVSAARIYHQQSLALARERNDLCGITICLNGLGIAAHLQGDYSEASNYYQQALELARTNGDIVSVSRSLNNLGIAAKQLGDYRFAADTLQQALTLSREMGDKHRAATNLSNLGIVIVTMGDLASANDAFQQALSLRREMGDNHGIGNVLHNLGDVALSKGDYTAAEDYHRQSLKLLQEFGYKHELASTFASLGDAMRHQQDYPTARDCYEQCLTSAQEFDNKRNTVLGIIGLAQTALEDRQTDFLPYLQEGLVTSLNLSVKPQLLTLLVVTGQWAARHGDTPAAARLAGLVDAHPACSPLIRIELVKLQQQLALLLPAEQLAALSAEGAALDLETTVREWLAQIEAVATEEQTFIEESSDDGK